MKIYTNDLGHMTNMAAMPIYSKNLIKSSSPEPIYPWPWNLVCSIIYVSITKVVQIKSLVWPWSILRQGQFGHIGFWMENCENYLFFGNYCSLRSQSCLKHLDKWVNDVKWVSKVSQGYSLTLVKGHSDFKVKTCFLQKQLSDLEPKLIQELEGE